MRFSILTVFFCVIFFLSGCTKSPIPGEGPAINLNLGRYDGNAEGYGLRSYYRITPNRTCVSANGDVLPTWDSLLQIITDSFGHQQAFLFGDQCQDHSSTPVSLNEIDAATYDPAHIGWGPGIYELRPTAPDGAALDSYGVALCSRTDSNSEQGVHYFVHFDKQDIEPWARFYASPGTLLPLPAEYIAGMEHPTRRLFSTDADGATTIIYATGSYVMQIDLNRKLAPDSNRFSATMETSSGDVSNWACRVQADKPDAAENALNQTMRFSGSGEILSGNFFHIVADYQCVPPGKNQIPRYSYQQTIHRTDSASFTLQQDNCQPGDPQPVSVRTFAVDPFNLVDQRGAIFDYFSDDKGPELGPYGGQSTLALCVWQGPTDSSSLVISFYIWGAPSKLTYRVYGSHSGYNFPLDFLYGSVFAGATHVNSGGKVALSAVRSHYQFGVNFSVGSSSSAEAIPATFHFSDSRGQTIQLPVGCYYNSSYEGSN